ncbi:MAG: ABC transporter permease [Prochlorothrix sp.]
MSKSVRPIRIIYTPESSLRHPRRLFRAMGGDLLASRELAWRLLVRDIKAQYRQSILGLVWAFVPPILTAAGLLAAKNVGAINVGATAIPYPAYVIFSMSLWQTFVEALSGPLAAVGAAKPMLARINFPREAIILAKIGEIFFNLAIKLILVIATFLWFQVPITPSILLTPVPVIHLVLLGTALGLLLAPLGALYGDIARLIPLIVTPWLLLTPVIYPVPTQGWLKVVVNLNPVTPLLVTARELATTGTLTDATSFWVVSGVAWGLILFAWLCYRLTMPMIVERISA